jgi:uracil-DNA glycosylase family 4
MTDASDQVTKARLRLWLNAEKAFGLRSLPRPARREIPQISRAVVQAPIAATEKIATGKVDLFGVEAPPPAPAKPAMMPSEPFTSPILPTNEKRIRLATLESKSVKVCKLCRLCETRTNTVFGEGDCDARVFFIGEGPGETEDQTGRPFVGRAGQLLDKMIAGMGLKREQVFIANIVKCRPPGNRVPAPDEVATCTPYLVEQLEIIRPKVIITLGLPSAKYVLQLNETMGRLRGRWHTWRGIKVMPTFHPAYLLRSYTEENRRMVWSDLQQVMAEVGLKPKK